MDRQSRRLRFAPNSTQSAGPDCHVAHTRCCILFAKAVTLQRLGSQLRAIGARIQVDIVDAVRGVPAQRDFNCNWLRLVLRQAT